MHAFKGKIKFLFLLPLLLVISSLIFHKSLIKLAANYYLNKEGISLDFEIDKIGTHSISLSKVHWEGVLSLNELEIAVNRYQKKIESIEKIRLDGEFLNLDFFLQDEPTENNKQETIPKTTKRKIDFNRIEREFFRGRGIDLELALNNIRWKDQNLPIALKTRHLKNQNHVLLNFAGEVKNLKSEKLNWTSGVYEGKVKFSITNENAVLNIERLNLKGSGLELVKESIKLDTLDYSLKADLDYKKSKDFILKGKMNITANGDRNGKPFFLKVVDLDLSSKKIEEDRIVLQGEALGVEALYQNKYSLDKLQIHLASEEKLKGEYSIEGFKFEDDKGEVLAKSLNLKGGIAKVEGDYRIEAKAFDSQKEVVLDGNALYNPKTGEVSLKYKTNKIVFDDDWHPHEAFPSLKKMVTKLGGKFSSYGKFDNKLGKVQTNIRFKANDFSAISEFLVIEGLTVDHQVVNHQSFASLGEHELLLQKVVFGATLENTKLKYQIINKSKIKIHSLETALEGARVSIKDVLIWPSKKEVSDLAANISNLDLEKAIKLGLKEGITASGNLSGRLEVSFKEKKPIIKNGFLKSNSKGWIRYRPEGVVQNSNLLDYVANPKELLNQYLYDFHYESLEADIVSDENYDMTMTLRAFGRNPKIMDGKPLKLNVNLELNLLSMFRSIIMTYHLPEKIKDKLLKVGKK